MPANISSGWTGSSLGPSYSIVNSILNPGGGSTHAPAPVTTPAPTAGHTPALPPTNTLPTGSRLPSTPPVLPPGWNSDFSSKFSSNLSPLGMGGRTSPQLTPEQAYANYLTARATAENSTPFSNALNVLGQGIFLPGVSGTQSNLPGQGFGFGAPSNNALPGYTPQATQILNQMMQGPQFSLAYGTPAANAPAPTPQWGYPSSYGSGWTAPANNNRGFGFGGGGIGFGF